MEKCMLLVSSDPNLYGATSPGSPLVAKYFTDVVIGDPSQELLEHIQRLVAEHDIRGVVTRGSWTLFLKSHLQIPVFPFKIDAADVYHNLSMLSDKGCRTIGLALFSYASDSGGTFGEIDRYRFGDLNLLISHVANNDEIAYVVDKMRSIYKVEYVLGDVEAVRAARALNMASSTILLANRFFLDAIDQAHYMMQLYERERRHGEYIHSITNIVSEAIVSFSPDGRILQYNVGAGTLLGLPGHDTIQEAAGATPRQLLDMGSNKVLDIKGRNFVANLVTITRGDEPMHTLLLNDAKAIQKIEMSIRRQSQERGLLAKYSFDDMVCHDVKSRTLVEAAKKYARSQGTILIIGETGTGKEVLASAIHRESPRQEGPFVALNCATLNENLIESELFGYEKGAFTGASSSGKKGLFEIAHRGTIFLDEIGDLPLHLQAKLLRVLQEREVMHIGGDKVIPVDVRVIAATNRDLQAMMREGSFREDLFYRLALLELHLQPLRQRRDDIVPLFTHFIDSHAKANGIRLYWPDTSIFEPMRDYDWPGNIRELENVAERLVLLAENAKIDRELITRLMKPKLEAAERTPTDRDAFTFPPNGDLKQLERAYIAHLLEENGGDRDALCRKLGISRPTLWRKLNQTDAG